MTVALDKMLALVGRKDIQYILGTGDAEGATVRDGQPGMDCAGAAISYAHNLKRHRPGFNRGPWASVSDDINTNSAIEDAEHKRELFEIVERELARPGDLIMYPTIRLRRIPPVKPFIGHVQMIVEAPPKWWLRGYAGLKVAHCHGPNGRRPAVTLASGGACDRHDEQWSKPEHRTRIVRPI